jgi:hypothetical protein
MHSPLAHRGRKNFACIMSAFEKRTASAEQQIWAHSRQCDAPQNVRFLDRLAGRLWRTWVDSGRSRCATSASALPNCAPKSGRPALGQLRVTAECAHPGHTGNLGRLSESGHSIPRRVGWEGWSGPSLEPSKRCAFYAAIRDHALRRKRIAYLRETRGRHSRVAGRLLDAIEGDPDHEYEHACGQDPLASLNGFFVKLEHP